jgi:hypothetical protein
MLLTWRQRHTLSMAEPQVVAKFSCAGNWLYCWYCTTRTRDFQLWRRHTRYWALQSR